MFLTATFIGHSECYGVSKEIVSPLIEQLINEGVTTFISGGMGQFDWICARAVFELKQKYPQITNELIIPYLTFTISDKGLFDSIVYPEGFEKYHFKAAIPARNKYLIENADYAICYITHSWGGAAQTFERAKKKGLRIINIADNM